MFERLEQAARRLAQVRADQRGMTIAETLRDTLPLGVQIERTDAGVRLSGRGLKRRLTLDPEARASIGRAR